MARHDEQALADESAVATFARLVQIEQEVLTFLERMIEGHRRMLAAMQGTDPVS